MKNSRTSLAGKFTLTIKQRTMVWLVRRWPYIPCKILLCYTSISNCAVPHRGSVEIPLGGRVGGGWVATSKVVKKSIELHVNCNFPRGGGCKPKKNLLWEGYEYFMDHTLKLRKLSLEFSEITKFAVLFFIYRFILVFIC